MTLSVLNAQRFEPPKLSPSFGVKIYRNDTKDFGWDLVYSKMNNEQIENNFEPYIKAFEQRWNAFLDRENWLFAEIYSQPVEGMIGVAFYAVNRQKYPTPMQIVNESFEKLRELFPNALWSQMVSGSSFIEVLENVIIVIKPNSRHCWGEKSGLDDADDTIGRHFVATMPEEWKYQK
jgi:hypothetical protein